MSIFECASCNAIKIKLANENVQTFYLDENPLITISNGQFNIRTAVGSVSLKLTDLVSYTFEQDNSGINLPGYQADPAYYYDGATITVNAGKEGCDVSMTTLDGITLLKKHLDTETTLNIDASEYASGVYLLTINGVSTKIAIR